MHWYKSDLQMLGSRFQFSYSKTIIGYSDTDIKIILYHYVYLNIDFLILGFIVFIEGTPKNVSYKW